MVDKSDWRLQEQEKYLKGVSLIHQLYRRYPKDSDSDHDHCSFCWKKFMVEDHPNVVQQGWSTMDDYYWICEDCFADFREMFDWTVTEKTRY